MVVGTTLQIQPVHTPCLSMFSISTDGEVYSIQLYEMKCVTDLHQVMWFSPVSVTNTTDGHKPMT